MRKLLFAAVLIAAMTIVGCVPYSIHPLCSDNDLVTEPTLAGVWGQDDQNKMTFIANDDKTYKLIHVDDGLAAEFEVRLFKVKDWLMMDICPGEPPEDMNQTYKDMILPLHFLLRVDKTKPDLVLGSLDFDWLKATLAADPTLLDYTEYSGSVIITAQTEKIQAFLKEHLTDESFDNDTMDTPRLE
ncbi:MAG: hypothetical protein ABIE70_13810 [bacterium]